ncbi:YjgN family protein [Rhodobacteraceae bacterium]|nr:YjgN family protein [Paracoccaceae bacterium]
MSNTPIPVKFNGTAKEFFGIWIVNILLSIITIGIYSAWAKVRTKKYFYQNTYIADRNFNYHATGGQILKGRLIVIGFFVLYSIMLSVLPPVGVIMILIAAILFPYLILLSIRFNAAYSSWANVRFGFDGTAGQAYKNYLLYPIGVALTLYLFFPFLWRANSRFVVNNHRLGQSKFGFDAGIGKFYLAMMFYVIAGIVGMAALIPAISSLTNMGRGQIGNEAEIIAAILPAYFIFIVLFVIAAIAAKTMIRNLIFNNMWLGDDYHRFASTMSIWAMIWISLSNAVVVVLTLGLMSPWAQIRMARYAANHTTVIPNGELDTFIGDITKDQSAIGDAYVDIEGIDLGIGI